MQQASSRALENPAIANYRFKALNWEDPFGWWRGASLFIMSSRP
jgi:hypothetical protein